jgi:hypothetical protein
MVKSLLIRFFGVCLSLLSLSNLAFSSTSTETVEVAVFNNPFEVEVDVEDADLARLPSPAYMLPSFVANTSPSGKISKEEYEFETQGIGVEIWMLKREFVRNPEVCASILINQLNSYREEGTLGMAVDSYMSFIKEHSEFFADNSALFSFLTKQGCGELLGAFLKAGFYVNAKDAKGYTLLHYAAQHNCHNAVGMLKNQGAKCLRADAVSYFCCWTCKGKYPEALTTDKLIKNLLEEVEHIR